MTTSNFSVSKSLKNVSSSVTPTTLALPSIGGSILPARSAITGSHPRIMVVLALASPSAHEADPAISPIIRSLAASPIVATVRRVQSEAVSRVALTSMQRGVSRKHDGKQRVGRHVGLGEEITELRGTRVTASPSGNARTRHFIHPSRCTDRVRDMLHSQTLSTLHALSTSL